MPRHRGTYNPEREEPYEVSRYQIENFIKCPACFWMNRAKGIKFPGMPGFLLNTATDTLLKKDFDVYREKQQPHPVMLNERLHFNFGSENDQYKASLESRIRSKGDFCLLYTSPSPRDRQKSRMPSSA